MAKKTKKTAGKKVKKKKQRSTGSAKKGSKAAVRPAKKKTYTDLEYMEMSKSQLGGMLTVKQKRFAVLYISDREFFGNGVTSYAEAYGVDLSKRGAYSVCASGANENLNKPEILAYMNKLLDAAGLNNAFADKQLFFMMTQCVDLKTKLGAYKEYNALMARIQQRLNVGFDVNFNEKKNYGNPTPGETDG